MPVKLGKNQIPHLKVKYLFLRLYTQKKSFPQSKSGHILPNKVSIIISADMFVMILDSNSQLILVTKDLKFTHVKIFFSYSFESAG